MMSRRRFGAYLLLVAMLLGANIALGEVAEARGECENGNGRNGIYDGPWPTSVYCQDSNWCWEAECNSCPNFWSAHCLLEHVCPGQLCVG